MPKTCWISYEGNIARIVKEKERFENNTENAAKYCHEGMVELVQKIKSPIDIWAYIKNPVYGPVAFCNKNHIGVNEFLDDLKLYHRWGEKTQKKKDKKWKMFAELHLSFSEYAVKSSALQRKNKMTEDKEKNSNDIVEDNTP